MATPPSETSTWSKVSQDGDGELPCDESVMKPEDHPILREYCEMVLSRTMVIPAEKFEALKKAYAKDSETAMWKDLIWAASKRASAPISGFCVAALGVGASGALYAGVNMEFPGMPLSASVHAEQFLVVNALLHEETALRYIRVSAPPCGHCRQFLAELNEVDDMLIAFGDGSPMTLDELLPHRFRPSDLLGNETELRPVLCKAARSEAALFKMHLNGYSVDSPSVDLDSKDSIDRVLAVAVEAAQYCHAPYTGCLSGAAIKLRGSDVIYSGGYIESVAYNPSISPLHGALIKMRLSGHFRWKDIDMVVLVDEEKAVVNHEATSRLLLTAIAPDARLFCSLGNNK